MNLLTGQIDLNLIQSKIGIGIDQLTSFMQGQGVEAITNWINLQIAFNAVGIIAVVIVWTILGLFSKKLYNLLESDEAPLIFIWFLVGIAGITILACSVGGLLAWSVAPEITFIQHFIR